MIKLITIKHLDKWNACGRFDGGQYSDEVLVRLLKHREGWTPLEVANLRQVSVVDRLWVLERKEALGVKLYREYGYACADRVVRKYALKHESTKEWAKRWLSPSRTTAVSAEWAAIAASARDATWAARAAMAARAGAAARAARAARSLYASRAAWAASVAEAKWQLAWLRKRLKESGGNDD